MGSQNLWTTVGVDRYSNTDVSKLLQLSHHERTFLRGAMAALSFAGTMLGYYSVRVLLSRTSIAPVNPTFLPRMRGKPTVLLPLGLNFSYIFWNIGNEQRWLVTFVILWIGIKSIKLESDRDGISVTS